VHLFTNNDQLRSTLNNAKESGGIPTLLLIYVWRYAIIIENMMGGWFYGLSGYKFENY